jgi:hypothetical protein
MENRARSLFEGDQNAGFDFVYQMIINSASTRSLIEIEKIRSYL